MNRFSIINFQYNFQMEHPLSDPMRPSTLTQVDTPQSCCRFALAWADITPPVGIYHRMWGAATHDRSTGIHRPLLATALALAPTAQSDGVANAPPQVLVSIDHCLLWNAEMQALRERVARDADIALDRLHITCSHTHAAGLMDPARADLPGGDLIAPYLEFMAVAIADAVREALGSMKPLAIVYGQGRSSLARHRDFWDADSGQFVCGFNPEGISDDTLLVARLTDEQSQTVGTIVNYACHPTTLAWDNTLISPDYVGALRELVEDATGAPCLFLQGASGDLGPRQGYVGDTRVADRNGRELGYSALAALESLGEPGQRFEYAGPVVSGATIGTWKQVPLPPEVLCAKHRWRTDLFEINLDYRADLPTREDTEAQLKRWQMAESSAVAEGDLTKARDCHAQVERMQRQLSRLHSLPPGQHVPVTASIWQLGDAVWVALQGEHYSLLQRALRERFPERPILVCTVTDGWLPGYVPTADTYGKGIYQESVAIVAPGSLERLIEVLCRQIDACLSANG